ncbi:MAG: hypothetical protein A2172_04055 [Candidatus Woykebacteria bacterium RBG_13_40_15]|uniref:Uncharacterized protein n=1 Tax=Candidatus Woykebacteria bacterium RBG_13_40_15 TaxID=1802593 RepID=A0A1G1W6Y5_9BACT|nr:MAG: hypothetical protein A2172_04055 [Candidatus Woykebacteria bacterium RBG_13_40_15]
MSLVRSKKTHCNNQAKKQTAKSGRGKETPVENDGTGKKEVSFLTVCLLCIVGLLVVILVLLGASLRNTKNERNAALAERDQAVAQVGWCSAIEQAILLPARAGLATEVFLADYCTEDVELHQEPVCGLYVQFLEELLETGAHNYQPPDLLPSWLAAKANTVLLGAATSDTVLVRSWEEKNRASWKLANIVRGTLPTLLTNLADMPLLPNEPTAILTPAPTPRPVATMGPAKPRQETQEVYHQK